MGYDLHEKAAQIVREAGGRLVGRTRLQKIAFLTQLAGFAHDFPFEYRHYGPYSEELAEAMEIAVGLDFVDEEEKQSASGAWYSIYLSASAETETDRTRFVAAAAKIGAIELELAATAAFLFAEEGYGRKREGDPWKITALRKRSKATRARLKGAKEAYAKLLRIDTPRPLPPIA